MGQVGEANATPPEGQPSPRPWSLCWERRPARWTPQAPDSGREPADVSARTRPSRTCGGGFAAPATTFEPWVGPPRLPPPLRQSPQEGPGPSDAQWRRGQTRVLQKLRAAGPDPSPIGQHPPVSHGSAPTPPQASSTSSLRWRGGWEEAGSLEGSLLPVAKLPWGTPLRSDPSLRPSVGRPGGGAAARNWCSGLWLAWAGSPSRPCRAAQGRGARVRVGDLQCCGGLATGPGPTRPPSQGPLLVRLGSRVPAGGPEAAPAASCCAARAPPKALNVESAQHRGFLSLVITPFCPHPWAPPTACWGPGGLRPSHAAGTGWALAGSSLAAALCLEERASPGGRQVGRWVLCPGAAATNRHEPDGAKRRAFVPSQSAPRFPFRGPGLCGPGALGCPSLLSGTLVIGFGIPPKPRLMSSREP